MFIYTSMKTQSIKLRNIGIALAVFAIGSPIITSCSKDQKNNEITPLNDKLTISVSGINLDPSFKSSNNKLNYDIKEFEDADIAIAVADASPTDAIKFKSSTTYEPIDENVKYVIYIYEGNNLVTSKEFSAGTPGVIEGLNPSIEYDWAAVSYNSTTSSPGLNPGTDFTLPQNTDVLYDNGKINLSETPNLSVAFDHAMARIGIELNTMGVFGVITGTPGVSITSGGLRTGSLNLLTGEIAPSSSTYTPTFTYSNFIQVDSGKNDALHTYFYTVPNSETEEQPIVVNIKNLTISHYDGNQPRTYYNSTSGVNFNLNITAQKGKSKKATINVVESALDTRINGTNVGWARSNLYYRDGEDENRAYAFNYNNRMHANGNSYFAFNTKYPLIFPQTAAEVGDPCLEVYPKNLWKTPTKEQLGLLASGDLNIAPLVDEVAGTLVNILDGVLGNLLGGSAAPNSITNFIPSRVAGKTEYDTNIIQRGRPASGSNAFGNADSQSNKLTFFYNGQVTNTTVLQGIGTSNQAGLLSLRLSDLNANGSSIIGLNIPILPSYSETASLWSSSDGIDLLDLVGAGSWGYFTHQNKALGFIDVGSSSARTSAELLDIELLGTGLIESSMKNVRCVRSTDPTF